MTKDEVPPRPTKLELQVWIAKPETRLLVRELLIACQAPVNGHGEPGYPILKNGLDILDVMKMSKAINEFRVALIDEALGIDRDAKA